MDNNKHKNTKAKHSPKTSVKVDTPENNNKPNNQALKSETANTGETVNAKFVDTSVTNTPKSQEQKAIVNDNDLASTAKNPPKPDTLSKTDMRRKNQKNTPAKNAAHTPHNTTENSNNTPVKQADKTNENTEKKAVDKPAQPHTSEKKATPQDNPASQSKDTSKAEKKTVDEPANTSNRKPPAPNNTRPSEAKKSGGIIPKAALLLGVIGTGIGVYDYDQIRNLKSQNDTSELVAQLNAAEAKIVELSARNTDALEQTVTTLTNDVTALKTGNARVNERLSAIEQTQNGLSKTLQGDLNKTLNERLSEVNALLKKVEQIEMMQEGLTKNLSQVTAAGEAVTSTGMAKQEIGYLLRMADYKIVSEGDTVGATGLLKIAEDKLLLVNKGQVNDLITAIRQKLTQLAGVQPIDPDAIILDLKAVSRDIPKLVAKSNAQASASSEADMKKAATDSKTGILSSIGNVIASGVKYTPNDPSKMDISAETVVLEKRLMQADIRTAELAVRSQNQVLLAESLRSINDSLNTYFAKDATASSISKTLADIEQRKLETVLPNLGTLVKQFEGRQ